MYLVSLSLNLLKRNSSFYMFLNIECFKNIFKKRGSPHLLLTNFTKGSKFEDFQRTKTKYFFRGVSQKQPMWQKQK